MGVGQFQMGEYSYGTIRVVGKTGAVIVGKFCSIADNVTAIMVGHRTDWVTTYPFGARELRRNWEKAIEVTGHPKIYGDIVVENDVWVGQNAVLMGGITVGNGAVVSALSLVTKDVPPYAIVGGIPAIVLKYRFDERQIEALLRIAWWNWPDSIVEREIKRLCSTDVNDFIRRFI